MAKVIHVSELKKLIGSSRSISRANEIKIPESQRKYDRIRMTDEKTEKVLQRSNT